tara:strand:- start:532 stop:2397 length:1866 start_codon:yes stop_codon:yes gene_type:complete
MPLKKLALRPGVNRERTRYTNETGWYECDKVRFRQGYPEKIGGWQRLSSNTFQGVCRSLLSWVTLGSQNFIGVGTNLKFYLELGGVYYDITPIRATTVGAATFAAANGSTTITVTDSTHGASVGDFVTFSGAATLGGTITAAVLNAEYEIITVPTSNTYTITATATANASDTGNGGGSVTAAYQISIGNAVAIPINGWGAGPWGSGTWGVGTASQSPMRLWSQSNFGEDLVFGPRGGSFYYWDVSSGITARGVNISTLAGASDVPTIQNYILVSDLNRFAFAFGANTIGTATQDPMLIRWSDQEDITNWTPAAINQAGSLRLSNGTQIVTASQSRQEVLVWTDSSLYSLQYLGGQAVWGAQLVGENISIASQNTVAYANGVSYWMGKDKFYMYDGRTQTLPCDLRRYIFNDFNELQYNQVHGGTNEEFHEIWWFYCSKNSTTVDRYVVYNYLEKVWYYGNLARTAWLDSGTRTRPLAATYSYNLVNHEEGVDDNETAVAAAIDAHITSGEFDLDDGDKFSFVWRVLPDITFDGSTVISPAALMTLYPLKNSGAGYTDPASEGGVSYGSITQTAVLPVEEFTQQLNIRVRGRQMAVKVSSDALGVQWQLGSPRLDMRPDGRR